MVGGREFICILSPHDPLYERKSGPRKGEYTRPGLSQLGYTPRADRHYMALPPLRPLSLCIVASVKTLPM